MYTLLKTGLLAVAALLLLSDAVQAQNSPVGRWRTIDDRSGQPRSIVEIQEVDGKLVGHLREVFREGAEGDVCDECPEGRGKGQPLIGLQLIWDVEPDGDEWGGGEILDPESGKIYGVKLKPIEGGRRLEVRGFLRVPLMGSTLGRTQTWERVTS